MRFSPVAGAPPILPNTIPTPQPNETKEQFIERCMSDEKMVAEYDAPQRYAVCSLQLKERK